MLLRYRADEGASATRQATTARQVLSVCERVDVTVMLQSCYCVTELMKEPVLQDKRLQHVKFCRCASELIERVLGKPQNASIEASLERIRKVGHMSTHHFLCLIITFAH